MQWKHGVLATGLPGRSLFISFKVGSTFKMHTCLALDPQLLRVKAFSFFPDRKERGTQDTQVLEQQGR